MADVLIFEDDPQIGDLMSALLRARGLTVSHFVSGAGALQLVQENKPRLVVLDIMMPGMDGLSVCRTLKSNPATKAVKVAVVTAKVYKEDREAALRHGADLYLTKPFGSVEFDASVGRLLGMASVRGGAPEPPAPPLAASVLPGSVVIESAALWLVLDAGAGLAAWLGKRGAAAPVNWVLLSRYQRPAVAEIAATRSLLAAGARVNLAGPDDPDGSLQKLGPYACATLPSGARAMPMLYPLREGEISLAPGVRASTCYTQHPGTCLAYRVELQGRAIVYCPVNEVASDPKLVGAHEVSKFRRLFEDADLVLHGFRRSLAQPHPRDDIGGAAWEPIVDLAMQANAKNLLLLPLGGVEPPPDLQAQAQARVAQRDHPLRVYVSRLSERLVL